MFAKPNKSQQKSKFKFPNSSNKRYLHDLKKPFRLLCSSRPYLFFILSLALLSTVTITNPINTFDVHASLLNDDATDITKPPSGLESSENLPSFGTDITKKIYGFDSFGNEITDEDDDLFGNDDDNTIYGRGGDDYISGGEGDDKLYGNEGNDRIQGNSGDDIISGGDGNDVLRGGPGNEYMFRGKGADDMEGGTGDNVMTGQANSDRFVVGNDGDDIISGNSGDDRLIGGEGDDELKGGDGNDYLEGGPGRDYLEGGPGRDYFHCGSGDDHIDDFDVQEDTVDSSCEGMLIGVPMEDSPISSTLSIDSSGSQEGLQDNESGPQDEELNLELPPCPQGEITTTDCIPQEENKQEYCEPGGITGDYDNDPCEENDNGNSEERADRDRDRQEREKDYGGPCAICKQE